MLFIFILLGTLLAGVGSVFLARAISPSAAGRYASDMLSFAAGALLATACVHLLPEAFESSVEPRNICVTLLAGLVLFFVLDKVELWHHGHEHHDEVLTTGHGPDSASAGGGAWAVLIGDSMHCFGDGLLIAAAFIADVKLGALASLAVLTHEIPHHMGDLAVMLQSRAGKRYAALKVALAGAVTVLGGVIGYWLVEALRPFLPYFLVAAASSFVYVALADLIPQLQKHGGRGQVLRHIFWLGLGIAVVVITTSFDVDG
jgi:zinc and cadmium transporter